MQVDYDPRWMNEGKRSPDYMPAIQEAYDERMRTDAHQGPADTCRGLGKCGPEEQSRHYHRQKSLLHGLRLSTTSSPRGDIPRRWARRPSSASASETSTSGRQRPSARSGHSTSMSVRASR